MKLSDEQQKAVYANDRFIFLLASAGSGKTTVIIERIKYLLSQNVNPEDVLAITFTRKATKEMALRLKRDNLCIQTFHRFCLERLKQDFNYDYLLEDGTNTLFTKETLLKISVYKNNGKVGKQPTHFRKYEQFLESQNKKDFDDLLLDFLKQVEKHKKTYNYNYIFIDEFQDTNEVQYQILKSLVNPKTYVFTVGDPDQSIYKFRGASGYVIDEFIKTYHAKVYHLNTNYRSDQNIIKAANALIENNRRLFKKTLYTNQVKTGHTKVMTFEDEDQEAFYIISHIKELNKNKFKHSEIAILYRIHRRSYTLQYYLIEANIAFQSYEEETSYENIINGIQMLTVHKAKGLEFDVVILLGLEDQIFPMNKEHTKSETEEERRLMFVAITRARHRILITNVQTNSFGKRTKPSLFIQESGVKSL